MSGGLKGKKVLGSERNATQAGRSRSFGKEGKSQTWLSQEKRASEDGGGTEKKLKRVVEVEEKFCGGISLDTPGKKKKEKN